MDNSAGDKQKADWDEKSRDIFGDWMKASFDFWEKMAEIQTKTFFNDRFPGYDNKNPFEGFGKTQAVKTGRMWNLTNKMLQKFMEQLTDSNAYETLKPIFETIPELLMKSSSDIMEGMMKLQEKAMEHAAGFGNKTEAYDFSDLNKNIFNSFREVYEDEFQKLFNIPKLGLNRFYQERFDQYLDSAALFNTSISEFVHTFYAPLEKTADVMQEKMDQMLDEGIFPENYKELYLIWVKTLEGHYMTLLQSEEYTRILHKTLEALADFRNSKNAVMEDFLSTVPVPTQSEMDELYKDLYLLKKRVRVLEKEKFRDVPAKENNDGNTFIDENEQADENKQAS